MANSQLHGIILDLPDVVPSARAAASALGLAERSKALAGDFFTYVPEADIYLLAHILHDWYDGEAVQILKLVEEHCQIVFNTTEILNSATTPKPLASKMDHLFQFDPSAKAP
jgi:hypothetical protein